MQYAQKHNAMHMRELGRKQGPCWSYILFIILYKVYTVVNLDGLIVDTVVMLKNDIQTAV